MNGTFEVCPLRLLAGAITGVLLVAALFAIHVFGNASTASVFRTYLDDHHIAGPRTSLWRKADALSHRDAAADARHALRSGDKRLLGLATIGPFLPGTSESEYASLSAAYGVRFLWAGCVTSSKEEGTLRAAQARYAARYNREILAITKGTKSAA